MTDTILSIALALFGGLNIFQFIFFRTTKQKYEAEAQKERLEARRQGEHRRNEESEQVQAAPDRAACVEMRM